MCFGRMSAAATGDVSPSRSVGTPPAGTITLRARRPQEDPGEHLEATLEALGVVRVQVVADHRPPEALGHVAAAVSWTITPKDAVLRA